MTLEDSDDVNKRKYDSQIQQLTSRPLFLPAGLAGDFTGSVYSIYDVVNLFQSELDLRIKLASSLVLGVERLSSMVSGCVAPYDLYPIERP